MFRVGRSAGLGAVALSSGEAPAGPPAVASDGSSFLVTWGSSRLQALRVSSAGAPLDAEPLEIAALPGAHVPRHVTWDGERYLVTWLRGRRTNSGLGGILLLQVAGAFVDADGTVGSEFPISQAEDMNTRHFAAAAGPDATLAVWNDSGGIKGAFVRRSGAVSGPIHLAPRGYLPRVTSTGSSFLVLWFDQQALFRAVVEPDGDVVPSGAPLPTGVGMFGFLAVAQFNAGVIALGGFDDADALVFDTAGTPITPVLPVSRTQLDERQGVVVGAGNAALAIYAREADRAGSQVRRRVFLRKIYPFAPRRRAVSK